MQISAASYSSSAFTVTLLTRKTLALNPPLQLTVKAASLLDALGRELDGNGSGQLGANFTAVLSKAGTSVTSARALARIGGLSPHAVDAVLETALRARKTINYRFPECVRVAGMSNCKLTESQGGELIAAGCEDRLSPEGGT